MKKILKGILILLLVLLLAAAGFVYYAYRKVSNIPAYADRFTDYETELEQYKDSRFEDFIFYDQKNYKFSYSVPLTLLYRTINIASMSDFLGLPDDVQIRQMGIVPDTENKKVDIYLDISYRNLVDTCLIIKTQYMVSQDGERLEMRYDDFFIVHDYVTDKLRIRVYSKVNRLKTFRNRLTRKNELNDILVRTLCKRLRSLTFLIRDKIISVHKIQALRSRKVSGFGSRTARRILLNFLNKSRVRKRKIHKKLVVVKHNNLLVRIVKIHSEHVRSLERHFTAHLGSAGIDSKRSLVIFYSGIVLAHGLKEISCSKNSLVRILRRNKCQHKTKQNENKAFFHHKNLIAMMINNK